MKSAPLAALFAFVTLGAFAQTRIASDIEIRQMEEAARSGDLATRVAVHINLGELRRLRNEPAAAEREFQSALQLARAERNDAYREHELPRYAVACAWLGVALAALGHGVEAFTVLEEAVRHGSDLRGVWNVYSVAMYLLHKPEKAIGAARMSVKAAERTLAGRPTVRELLELNVDRFALAQGLLDSGTGEAEKEAEQILVRITESLEGDPFAALRKSLGKREEFQVVTAPTTDGGVYLSTFNRSHMRLGQLYEANGAADKAIREYKAVVSRRSDEAMALGSLARLTSDVKEKDRYFIQSLDANPFADEVVADYISHVESGHASPPARSASVGSRVRTVIHQLHERDFRHAQETLQALMDEHPRNDVLQFLLAKLELRRGDAATARAVAKGITDPELRSEVMSMIRNAPNRRPWFLDRPPAAAVEPAQADLRMLLNLFAGNSMSAEDRVTLDRAEFTGIATFEPSEEEAFERGTIEDVPFRFQSPARFRGIPPAATRLRLTYRILGATTLDGRDALLLEPVRAEVEK